MVARDRLESNLIVEMQNSYNSGRVKGDVLYLLERLSDAFQSRLIELGLKIVCSRSMKEAFAATGDLALADAKKFTQAVFSPNKKTLYVAETPDCEEVNDMLIFEFSLELMKAFAILSGLDLESVKNVVSRDLLNHSPKSGPKLDPIREFSFCTRAFLENPKRDTYVFLRCKRNYPETMEFIEEQFTEFL
jgi:hypothetical protein